MSLFRQAVSEPTLLWNQFHFKCLFAVARARRFVLATEQDE